MRKHLLTLLMASLCVCGFAQTTQTAGKKAPAKNTAVKSAPKVYICEGGSAFAYHSSSSCSGLNRCTHTVSEVTKANAEGNHGRRPCKKCY